MTNQVLAALAQARMRAAPMFARWCELNGASWCPAVPADVAKFVSDCASLGIERLWPAVQEISKAHVSLGLADPTLGGLAAAAIGDVAGISPPRSWPSERKQHFRSLPYDMQVYLASREEQRDRAVRRAQNEAAVAKQKTNERSKPATTDEGAEIHDLKGNEVDASPDAGGPHPANPSRN
jgi:hypothetical protein